MKINNFRGELTDISAKKEALILSDQNAWFDELKAKHLDYSSTGVSREVKPRQVGFLIPWTI